MSRRRAERVTGWPAHPAAEDGEGDRATRVPRQRAQHLRRDDRYWRAGGRSTRDEPASDAQLQFRAGGLRTLLAPVVEVGKGLALALALPAVVVRVQLLDMLVAPPTVFGIDALVVCGVLLVAPRVLRLAIALMSSHELPLCVLMGCRIAQQTTKPGHLLSMEGLGVTRDARRT